MGQKTGVDLDGEEIGIVRWPDNPTTIWNPIDLDTNSFGQGLSVTPLQMVTAVSAIANGGTLYTPYVVARVERHGDLVQDHQPQAVRQVIRPEVAAAVRQMMTEATHNAEADKINLPGYAIAAKTGTAQIPDPQTGKYVEDKTIASIISIFPADKPLFTVLIGSTSRRRTRSGPMSPRPRSVGSRASSCAMRACRRRRRGSHDPPA